jgi:hypothetical protein
MHRSGTSALARVLNLLGVELGTDLLPPAADNEMGFWEHRHVQFIHDRIYEAFQSDWTHVSPLPPNWWTRPEIEPYRQQLRETLLRDFGNQPLWGIKDPRLCPMLPLWRPLLAEMGVQPRCVLICRNPLEVASSLTKRDGMSQARTCLLWLRSIIDSERGSRGLPRLILTFDQLLADWAAQANRISLALDLKFPRSPADISDAVSDFLRPSVRHHRIADDQLLSDPQVPALVRRMYAAVLKSAASGETEELSATVDTLADELDHSQPLLTDFIRTVEQERRTTVIEKNVAALQWGAKAGEFQTSLNTAASDAAEKANQIASLQQQLQQSQAQTQAQTEAQAQAVAQLQTQLAAAHSAAAQAAAQAAADFNQQRLALEHQINQIQSALDAQIDLLNKHRQRTQLIQIELSQYQIQRMVLLKVLDLMKQTRAWRWTAALPLGRSKPLTESELIPVSPMRSLGPNRWACDTPAQMVLPCLPLTGKIALSLHLTVSLPGEAHLYFDTGNLFNATDHVALGAVEDEILITTEITLPAPVHCFRLDPLDKPGELTLHSFEIKSIN